MSIESPKSLREIRERLSPLQLKALKQCWHHFRETGTWIQTRALHVRLEDPHAERELRQMSGSLIFTTHFNNALRYQLTGLGIFASDESGSLMNLAASLLKRLVELFVEKPERDEVPIAEVIGIVDPALADEGRNGITEKSGAVGEDFRKNALKLPVCATDDGLLLSLVQNTNCMLGSASGSIAAYRWNVHFPERIEWVRFESDLYAYLENQLLAQYDPSEPMDEGERLRRHFELQQRSTSVLLGGRDHLGTALKTQALFDFVNHEELRALLESDWREAQAAFAVGAWKGCVILCAGIIEGVLGHALTMREADSGHVSVEGNATDWNLDEMIKRAHKDGLIRSSSFNLYQAVRQVRNLVHPRRQLKEEINIQESDALYAKAAVADIARELGGSSLPSQ